ncbi:hypothetical protein FAUST_1447 [Fusarium austroamericanum]|uniref:Peptidase S8/S53 domain-containing protein n=1 Tax=Fusarium austroamericanum TaxID=282268 RepID=A0AAN6C8F9_FUSAU|nr:hypothetical protein FAUST_1447 [Fusarium austroamericanum]
MPSLEADGPELQALDVIRRLVVPLVEKNIIKGTQNAQSLAVQNSLDLLRFEMSSLLFWITKGHELNDQEHDTFLQDLQSVLQLLEGFIDPQVVGRGKGKIPEAFNSNDKRRFPKLHAVIQEASQNDTQFDLETIISLPEAEGPARAACETVTKFNANNQRRCDGDHTGSSRTQADQKSTEFHADHPCIRQSQLCSSMFKAWAHHFGTSGCHSHHAGKLQACAFELDGSGFQDVVQHKMYISPCNPENRWQEVTCTVVCNLPDATSSLCEIDNICQAIGDSLSDEEMLSLWICSERIWHDSEADPSLINNLHISPTLSLEQILRQHTCKFGPNGRVTLAYSLACTLLRIYSAEMQQEWGPEDIYFLYNSKERTIHEPDYPYVTSTFLSDRPPVKIKNRFPVLIHFAKLLLEIGLGQLFVPKRLRFDIELMEWAQSDDAKESLVQGHFNAVMECLQAKKTGRMDDPMDEETQCRKVLFNLVSHLNEARNSYRALDPKRTQKISMLDSTSIEPTVDHLPPQQHPLSRKDLSALLPTKRSSGRMFDEQKLQLCDADQSEINSAEEFLELAEKFYECSISGITSSPDIRIAILDTGIQTRNSFIKGAKYNRNDQDFPIKASKSFVSEHPDDECGHGTNIASLILRIFPQANLYIAKIARGLEQDGVDQIVEAIKWARTFNVHIVNMSFSIPKTSAVKKIIKEAENDGVIMFVAASNKGINTGRSFPATLDTVLCIHAADGKGNKGGMNPDPEPHRDNFSTLGVAIPSIWENGVYLSGTSYATPVAAAMAAVILAFIEAAVAAGQMPKEIRDEAFDRQGMKNVG